MPPVAGGDDSTATSDVWCVVSVLHPAAVVSSGSQGVTVLCK